MPAQTRAIHFCHLNNRGAGMKLGTGLGFCRTGAAGPVFQNTFAVQKTEPFDGSALDTSYWSAQQPARVTVSGGNVSLTATAAGYLDNNVYATSALSTADTLVSVDVPAGVSQEALGLVARRDASGNSYLVGLTVSAGIRTYRLTQPSTSSPLDIAWTTPHNLFSSGGTLEMYAVGASPTRIITVIKNTAGKVMAVQTMTDSTAGYQTAGSVGFAGWTTGPAVLSNARIYTRQSTSQGPIKTLKIGDSLTEGYLTSGGAARTVAQEDTAMANITGLTFNTQIQGVGGTTTTDWLPGTGNLNTAISTANANSVEVISVWLGTNDCNGILLTPVATYLSNLQSICAALFANVPTLKSIILNGPPWHGAVSANRSATTLALAQTYCAQLPTICTGFNGRGILLGDVSSIDYFANKTTLYNSDQVHLNDSGAVRCGLIHALTTAKVLGLIP